MNQFHVGQRVVCVANGHWEQLQTAGRAVPVRGEVYTVRDVYIEAADGVTVGIHLKEIVNPADIPGLLYLREVGWRADEFRPVKETNIDVFLAMLKKVPEEVG